MDMPGCGATPREAASNAGLRGHDRQPGNSCGSSRTATSPVSISYTSSDGETLTHRGLVPDVGDPREWREFDTSGQA